MAKLKAQFAPSFSRDVKRLAKKHVDTRPLSEVIDLIIENTPESVETLKRRHDMHMLVGNWSGSSECHVCNAGDWLLVWRTSGVIALMQRTGSHDELFKKVFQCLFAVGRFALRLRSDAGLAPACLPQRIIDLRRCCVFAQLQLDSRR